MRLLVTGASGYVGSLLLNRLVGDPALRLPFPYAVRALAREPCRVAAPPSLELLAGDLMSGAGLDRALEGVDVAFYLIHSMETTRKGSMRKFPERERLAAETFALHAGRAGLERIVYLGGPLPHSVRSSRHLHSRAAVERILMDAVPDSVTLRASIVLGARSRSFRLLVRLVERLPVLTLPPWSGARTQPVDERDLVDMLLACARSAAARGRSLDVGGPRSLTYGEMIERIAELMLVERPCLPVALAPIEIAARLAAALAGEDPTLAIALMESLEHGDLLPTQPEGPQLAADLLGVTLHSFDSSVEHALREWELTEPLRTLRASAQNPMSMVSASITIPRPPAEVWQVAMDPHRLGDWVTIHRALIRADQGPLRPGYEMEQRIALRNVSIDIHWLLIQSRPDQLAVWEGRGPARSCAWIEYSLSAEPDGATRFDYRNEFRVPFGALGALASRALIGGTPESEARRTLQRLRELLA